MLQLRSRIGYLIAGILAVGIIAAACGGDDDEKTLTLITHDSFDISEETIAAFELEFDATVTILPTGDAIESLNRAILTKNDPEGDLLFGVDNISYVRGVAEGIFVVYRSPELANVDERWVFDDSGQVTPIDYGYVLFNYQKSALEEAGLQPPTRLEELTQPEWKGRVAVQDPNTSSPGLQFMLATIAYFGEDSGYTWLDFWRDLRANDLILTSDWSSAYYTRFSQYGGDAWLVNSYATSPPAEVIFAEERPDTPPTANVIIPNATFLQIEGVAILKNAKNMDLAKKFVDFMLSQQFQEDIPLNMFVYPVRTGAALPQEFIDFGEIPENVAEVDADRVRENLERWLDEWTRVVTR